ncbi:MAG: hypothetical protein O2887_16545 [Bacteroidetes bacterium]|nr:hypothetical protein [Bacteroidota bacterium]MDA1122072.1 hypothetical protein [Bacteroidota bacterium]
MRKLILGLVVILALGCRKQDDPFVDPLAGRATYNFEEGLQGWEGGFADFPLDFEDSVMFELDTAILPVGTPERTVRLSGNDVNRDLFMFIKQKIGPLDPNTAYRITFVMDILAQNLEEVEEINTNPFIVPKVGASTMDPKLITTADTDELGYLGMTLNIDKGNGNSGGLDMIALSPVELSTDPGASTSPASINSGSEVFRATTDSNGEIWLIIGTDSESGMKHAVYLDNLLIEFFTN